MFGYRPVLSTFSTVFIWTHSLICSLLGLFLPLSFLNSRTNLSPAARAATSRPQTAREDHPGPDGAKREAATHAADLLQRQPQARRPNEGAASGDDRPQPASDPGLVPEQAVQGQEEEHTDEAAAAAATQRQDGERPAAGFHKHTGKIELGRRRGSSSLLHY